MASAFGMRVVAREEIKTVVRLPHELAYVFVDVGCEGHVFDDLLRRSAAERRELRLRLAPDLCHPIESPYQRGYPPDAHFDHAAAESPMPLEHTIEEQRTDEGFRWLVQRCHVLAANVLAGSQPVARHGPSRIH